MFIALLNVIQSLVLSVYHKQKYLICGTVKIKNWYNLQI